MRLGNDIVDLKIDAHIHPRFLERILHPEEKKAYSGLKDSKEIWKIWAAKEATFKAHRQGPNPLGFLIPSRCQVDLQTMQAYLNHECYELKLEITEDYIHVLSQSECFPTETGIRGDCEELSPSRSQELANELRRSLGILQLPPKDAGGIPRLLIGGERRPYSLSHHGRFVAIALGKSSF